MYHSTAGGFTLNTAGPKIQSTHLSGGPIVSSATGRADPTVAGPSRIIYRFLSAVSHAAKKDAGCYETSVCVRTAYEN